MINATSGFFMIAFLLVSYAANVIQNHFDESGSPFSLREKERKRGLSQRER